MNTSKIIGEVYAEWAQEQAAAGTVLLDAEWAEADPSQYPEHAILMGATDEAQQDLADRTAAALAAYKEQTVRASAIARLQRTVLAWGPQVDVQLASLTAAASQAWRDQLRIPKGNGDRSGRWTFTPWKHLDDLTSVFNALGASEHPEVRVALQDAIDSLAGLDPDNFDPRDDALADAAKNAADALELAPQTGDPSLDDALSQASMGIREWADTDWTLFAEATDIGAADGDLGRAVKNVWEGDLPTDEAVDPSLAGKTSAELAEELERIKNHPVAPSPSARKKRAAYLKELNDRRDRDEGATPAPAPTPEPVAVEPEPVADNEFVPDRVTIDQVQPGDVISSFGTERPLTVVSTQVEKGRASDVSGASSRSDVYVVVGLTEDGHLREIRTTNTRAQYNRTAKVTPPETPERGDEKTRPADTKPGDRIWVPGVGDATVVEIRTGQGNSGQSTDLFVDSHLGDGPLNYRVQDRQWVRVTGHNEPVNPQYVAIMDEARRRYSDPEVARKEYFERVVDQVSREIKEGTLVLESNDELPEPFAQAYKALEEAGDDKKARLDALREIRRLAFNGRAGRTTDVLTDDGATALIDLISAISRDDATNLRDAVVMLQAALREDQTPARWKALSPLLDALLPPDSFGQRHEAMIQQLQEANDLDKAEAAVVALRRLYSDEATADPTNPKYPPAEIYSQLNKLETALQELNWDWANEALFQIERMTFNKDLNDEWRDTLNVLIDQAGTANGRWQKWVEDARPAISPRHQAIADMLGNKDIELEQVAFILKELESLALSDHAIFAQTSAIAHIIQASKALAQSEGSEFVQQLQFLRAALQRAPEPWSTLHRDAINADFQVRVRDLINQSANGHEADLRAKYDAIPPDDTTPVRVIKAVGIFYSARQKNSNCVLASTVYELRRRGIDVQPKQAEKGKNSSYAQQTWFFGGGYSNDTVVDSSLLYRRQFKARYQAIAQHGIDTYPVGSRGTIRSGWKGRNFGHIWNWERTEDGIAFYDAQTGQVIRPEREDYWGAMDHKYVTFARLDNLPLREDIEVALVSKSDAEKAKSLQGIGAQLINLKDQKDRLAHELEALRTKGPGWYSDEYKTARERYSVLSQSIKALLDSPEGERLTEVGRSYPVLHPDTFRMNP